MDDASFWLGGLTAVTGGLMAVTRRNAVASVMWLVGAFLGMSVLFLGMDAGFIGVIQVLVYAGAIMVLFLFVIMLLKLTPAGLARVDRPKMTIAGILAAGALTAILCAVAVASPAWTRDGTDAAIRARTGTLVQGRTAAVADRLFSDHLLPFEITSVLLLAAIVGSVALTKRKV
ncbi:MAG: NADH-quinone oxidoreductase subunit J [Planctomycetes bacterium]|nr:NADH-quinone oxidoreductase subunit J [Planctomycetota bacterium]